MSSQRRRVIVVDDNITNLDVCKHILSRYYEVFSAPSAEAMFALLEHIIPDMILLDVDMPHMNGYEAARLLKANSDLCDIPIIFLTGLQEPHHELEGLNIGAVDYIRKPFIAPLLLRRIETHLSLAAFERDLKNRLITATERVWQIQNVVLSVVTDLAENRSVAAIGHVARTQIYLSILLEKLISERIYIDEVLAWKVDSILLPAAQLHDIGKIGVRDAILNKPGKLTPTEREIMEKHVSIGLEAISRMEDAVENHEFFEHAKRFAGMHHERWDGTGYPNALQGLAIPLEGRLMAIVDVYDALVSVRPYKDALPPEESAAIIIGEKGLHFDPLLVDIFATVTDKFAEISKLN